jgi:hypothetical protein
MDFIQLGDLYGALIITLALMACHEFAPALLKFKLFKSLRFASFAGGAAVSYVFLHMLPGLIEAKAPLGEVLNQYHALTPLFDILIFIVALVGFNIYYGLECLVEKKEESKQQEWPGGYYLHLVLYGVSNFLITYTMPLRVQTGLVFAMVFTFAIGLHFILVDRRLVGRYPSLFSRSGRLVLLGSLFLGWLVSVVTDPINVFAVSVMIAFLSGSVLYGVFREELPVVQGAKFLSFTVGLLSVGALLVWQTILATGAAL